MKEEILFRVPCPALGLNVVLFKRTWKEHVLEGHPEMAGKIDLVMKTIKGCTSIDDIYSRDEKRIFIQKNYPDFSPANPDLRVTMSLQKKGYAIVTTAFPVKGLPRGVNKYEPGR